MIWTVIFTGHGKLLKLHLVATLWPKLCHCITHEVLLPTPAKVWALSELQQSVWRWWDMFTLLWVGPKQNLKDPTEDHLVPWHALTDKQRSILPVTECILLIQLIIYRLRKWLSFSEFPQQFEEAGLNSPLALTGATSLSICSLKHQTLIMKRCCTLPLITCRKTQNEKGNCLCHGPLTAHYLTIKYTLRAILW